MPARRPHATSAVPPAIHGLIERFPEIFGGNGTPRRGFAARHSRIDEFAGHGNQPPVIVKTITVSRTPEHAAHVAGREFAALGWLRARVDAHLRETIPEPLAWIPGSPAIAMRKLDGVTVAQLLRRHGTRPAVWGGPRLTTVGELVGRWLRAMHDATPSPDREVDGARWLADIDRDLDRAGGQGLSGRAVRRVREQASQAVGRLAGTRVSYAARQGDFTVSNILIDGSAVRIVDFENFGESDAIYEDIASFAGYLRMLGHSPAYSAARLAAMRRAFLRAYGQPEADPVLGLYELKHAVAVLALFPGNSSVVGRWRRQSLGREVVALADRLSVDGVSPHGTPAAADGSPPRRVR